MAQGNVEVGSLKKGDQFEDISAGSNTLGEEYVVIHVGEQNVEAMPMWDKLGENVAWFQLDEQVEVTI